MQTIFILKNSPLYEDYRFNCRRYLGIYSTYKQAESAKKRFKKKKLGNIRDFPVSVSELNHDDWGGGFVTVLNFRSNKEDYSDDNEKIIGFYRSYNKAKLAQQRQENRPEFIDLPNNFGIYSASLDKCHYKDGFLISVYHFRFEDTPDAEDKLIGIYRNRKEARLAIEKLKNKPKFIDFPDGFKMYEEPLNSKYSCWDSGFA